MTKFGQWILFSLALLLGTVNAMPVALQGENEVSLSIAQEAEGAIDRAQRWLQAQSLPASNPLFCYAQLPTGDVFRLSEADLATLKEAMPEPLELATLTNLVTQLEADLPPKTLYALQRDLPSATPPIYWREQMVRHLVNTQKIASKGGHWQTPEATVWAILTLRALLNDSNPILLESDETKSSY